MKDLAYQSDRRFRLAFGAAFIAGFATCTQGIMHATTSGWLHPATLSGIFLGVLALALGGSVLARRRIGPLSGDRSALIALLAIIAVKFLVSTLYTIIR